LGPENALDQPIPSLFLEDRSLSGRTGELDTANPGLRATISRTGEELTLIGAGRAAALAEDAADQLRAAGISTDVVSLCYARPLDRETILSSVQKTGRAIIVQDEPPNGGYGPVVRCVLDELPLRHLRTAPVFSHLRISPSVPYRGLDTGIGQGHRVRRARNGRRQTNKGTLNGT